MFLGKEPMNEIRYNKNGRRIGGGKMILRDTIPVIRRNDIQLLDSHEEEICLIRNGHSNVIRDEYLDTDVLDIWCDEDIPDTIIIKIRIS